MIQIISGEKGKGKTKILLDKVATEVKSATGSVVYLDKSTKHMYELSNKVRLINVRDYLIENRNEFIGFICGLVSQDHDLQIVYLDSFLKIACTEMNDITPVLEKLEKISETFHVDFVLSISANKEELPEAFRKDIIVAL